MTISGRSTMKEVLEAYPSAQRALFMRYHIGGCSGCGFSPEETLEAVLKRKNVLDVDEALAHIRASHEADERIQISPAELEALIKKGSVKLVDVRSPEEHGLVHIEGDVAVSEELIDEMKASWPKDTAIVFYCHFGNASLNAASYMIGHGFTNVKSLRGGIDAWSRAVDPLLPQYA